MSSTGPRPTEPERLSPDTSECLERSSARPASLPSDASPARQRRFSVVEYHRMIEAGILGEDEHVELLEGEIVQMPPQNERHFGPIVRLTRWFSCALPAEYEVRPQGPLTLRNSEPEPDLAIVRSRETASRRRHPKAALLVVEVADSSMRYDLQVKARIYARAGIPEYWLVVVPNRQVEVLRDPDRRRGASRSRRLLSEADVLAPAFKAGLKLPVRSLFD